MGCIAWNLVNVVKISFAIRCLAVCADMDSRVSKLHYPQHGFAGKEKTLNCWSWIIFLKMFSVKSANDIKFFLLHQDFPENCKVSSILGFSVTNSILWGTDRWRKKILKSFLIQRKKWWDISCQDSCTNWKPKKIFILTPVFGGFYLSLKRLLDSDLLSSRSVDLQVSSPFWTDLKLMNKMIDTEVKEKMEGSHQWKQVIFRTKEINDILTNGNPWEAL